MEITDLKMEMEKEKSQIFQISGYFSELSKQLRAIGNRLQSSQLLSEIRVLEKLIYKFKNQHRHEKYFKGLEKMKKSLNRWTMLSFNSKLLATSKSICDTDNEVKSTNHLKDLLTELMHGGKLAIRNIVLCQETVQYTLAYLSMGFFVTFHVTLISLISRIWVLLKDCWFSLIECYQLVRLLLQSETQQTTLGDFPECLTSWLCDDLNDVYTVSRNMGTNNSYFGLDSSEVLKRIFGKATDNDMFTSSARKDWLAYDNLDLGEPVEEFSQIESFGNCNATPISSKHGVSHDLKKRLALRFDLEHIDDDGNLESKTDRAELKNGRTLTKFGDSGSSVGLSGKTLPCNVRYLRRSDKPLVWTNRPKRTLHKVGEHIFIKKQPGRFTLRNLAAVNAGRGVPSRKVRALLKILRHVLRSEQPSADHNIQLKIQRLLRREMKRREFQKNKQGTAKIVSLKSESQTRRKSEILSNNERGCTKNSREANCTKISSRIKPGSKTENPARNWPLEGWHLKGWHLKGWRIRGASRRRRNEHRFSIRTNKSQRNNRASRLGDDQVSPSNERKGKDNEQRGSKRDEIDIIFSSLGL